MCLSGSGTAAQAGAIATRLRRQLRSAASMSASAPDFADEPRRWRAPRWPGLGAIRGANWRHLEWPQPSV